MNIKTKFNKGDTVFYIDMIMPLRAEMGVIGPRKIRGIAIVDMTFLSTGKVQHRHIAYYIGKEAYMEGMIFHTRKEANALLKTWQEGE